MDYTINNAQTSAYYVELFKDNKIGFFNRKYQPLRVDAQGDPRKIPVKKEQFERLKHFFTLEDNKIFLYLDKTNPFDYPDEPENKTLYTAKMKCIEQILGFDRD